MATRNHQRDTGNCFLKQAGTLTARIRANMFLSLATAPGGDTVVPFAVPADAIVTDAYFVVTTAFNGTGTNIEVGTKSDDDGFVTSANGTATVGTKVGSGTLLNAISGSDNLPIHVKLNWTSGANNKPTAGEGHVVIKYTTIGRSSGDPDYTGVEEVAEADL